MSRWKPLVCIETALLANKMITQLTSLLLPLLLNGVAAQSECPEVMILHQPVVYVCCGVTTHSILTQYVGSNTGIA